MVNNINFCHFIHNTICYFYIFCKIEKFSQMIFRDTIIGTAKIKPTNPQMYPQTESEAIIANGESPKFLPWTLGSTIFPRQKLIAVMKISVITILPGFGQNCKTEKKVVAKTEIIDPKFGIKFNTKAKNAQMIGKSKPTKRQPE